MKNARQWSNRLANMYFRLANETMVMHGVHNKYRTHVNKTTNEKKDLMVHCLVHEAWHIHF